VSARRPYILMSDCPHKQLEEAVLEVQDCEILPKEKVPTTISCWRVSDMFESVGEADWEMDCYEMVCSLAKVSERHDVHRFYTKGNEANCEHARRLTDGGNILVRESLRYRLCREKATGSRKVLLEFDVVPHMKGGKSSKVKSENTDGSDKEYYTIFLCFDYDTSKKSARHVAAHPLSCCCCHNGRYFCSHMLALLMVIQLMQTYSCDQFEMAYARSPLFIQNLPLLLENVTRRDKARHVARKKSKNVKRRTCNSWFKS